MDYHTVFVDEYLRTSDFEPFLELLWRWEVSPEYFGSVIRDYVLHFLQDDESVYGVLARFSSGFANWGHIGALWHEHFRNEHLAGLV